MPTLREQLLVLLGSSISSSCFLVMVIAFSRFIATGLQGFISYYLVILVNGGPRGGAYLFDFATCLLLLVVICLFSWWIATVVGLDCALNYYACI